MSEHHQVQDHEVTVQWHDAEGDIVLRGRISGGPSQQRLAAAFQTLPISVSFSGITVNVGGVGPSVSS